MTVLQTTIDKRVKSQNRRDSVKLNKAALLKRRSLLHAAKKDELVEENSDDNDDVILEQQLILKNEEIASLSQENRILNRTIQSMNKVSFIFWTQLLVTDDLLLHVYFLFVCNTLYNYSNL